MANPDHIHILLTSKIEELCSQQTNLYKSKPEASDDRYCYELLRRAAYNLPGAWEAVYRQYWPSVIAKVSRKLQENPQAVEDVAQEAMVRFHKRVVNPEQWHRFPDLPAVLQFLKACVHSSINDYYRREKTYHQFEDLFTEQTDPEKQLQKVRSFEDKIGFDEWRQSVKKCIERHYKHRFDPVLVEQGWLYGRTPKQLADLFPDKFPEVDYVYQLNRNLRNRIRRDPDCRQLLENGPKFE